MIDTASPGTGRKSRPAPSSDIAARELVDGYLAALLASKALKAGIRKSLLKIRTKLHQ